MRRRKVKKYRVLRRWLALCLAAVAALWLALDSALRPTAEAVAVYQARVFGARLLNAAVLEELSRSDMASEDLLLIQYDEHGAIASLHLNTLAAGVLKERVMQRMLAQLSAPQDHSMGIPVGTVLGWQVLSGRGPDLELRLLAAGAPEAEIKSSFESAGINQTRHRVSLDFSVEVQAILPGLSVPAEIGGEYVLAETVIVGEVPESYWGIGRESLDFSNAS